MKVDARTTTIRPTPSNALSEVEQRAVLEACNCEEHAHLPPSQIVPKLADQGLYLASESTFYRVLKAHDQGHAQSTSWGRLSTRTGAATATPDATDPLWRHGGQPSLVLGHHLLTFAGTWTVLLLVPGGRHLQPHQK